MRIALLGTRGIPANYGGFETFAEELSTRLVARGHEVTVYCRSNNVGNPGRGYKGVRLVVLPTIPHKYLDTLAHTALSTLDLVFRRADVALYCNAANAVFTLLPRMTGIPVALNVDGLERKRKKWNWFGRAWYRVSERLSTWFPNVVVTDADVIEEYYRERYGKKSTMIAYGAEVGRVETAEALDELGLERGKYFLYVSRMEPENNALLVRQAFERTSVDAKLVLVGDAPYADEYLAEVRDTEDPRIVIPGAIYGQGYKELQSHSLAYIHATEVGGTHPALIEALGRGAIVLYLDTPENREVAEPAGSAAFTNDPDALAEAIEATARSGAAERDAMHEHAIAHIQKHYSWDAIASQYEQLFSELAAR